MKESAPALFDMDGSLADYVGALVRDLELLRSPGEDPVTLENIWSLEQHAHIRVRMRLIKNQPGWWLNLEPLALGMDVLKEAKLLGFEVHVLTKGPKRHSQAWKEKVEWCQRHIHEEVDIHITSDKGMVYGKVLYDDYPDYMLRWLRHRPRGLGIMPVTPSNSDFKHPNVIMYRGPQDLETIRRGLQAAQARQPGQKLRLE